jgi:hypothetical protein
MPENILHKFLFGTKNSDNHQLTYVISDGIKNSFINI